MFVIFLLGCFFGNNRLVRSPREEISTDSLTSWSLLSPASLCISTGELLGHDQTWEVPERKQRQRLRVGVGLASKFGIWDFFSHLVLSNTQYHRRWFSSKGHSQTRLTTNFASWIRSDEGLTLETSAFRIPVRWSIYIINSVDKTKFLYTTPPTTQHHSFFWNYSLYFLQLTCHTRLTEPKKKTTQRFYYLKSRLPGVQSHARNLVQDFK